MGFEIWFLKVNNRPVRPNPPGPDLGDRGDHMQTLHKIYWWSEQLERSKLFQNAADKTLNLLLVKNQKATKVKELTHLFIVFIYLSCIHSDEGLQS